MMKPNSSVFFLAALLLTGIIFLGCVQTGTDNSNSFPTVVTNPPNPATLQTYSLAEIAAHDQTTDCWVALNGNVYDITEFLSMAPPASQNNAPPSNAFMQAFKEGCGKDISMQFQNIPRNPNGGDRNNTFFRDRNGSIADGNFPRDSNRFRGNTNGTRPPNGAGRGNFLTRYLIGKLQT